MRNLKDTNIYHCEHDIWNYEDIDFRKRFLQIIDWEKYIWAMIKWTDNSKILNENLFISKLPHNNRQNSLSPHIDTLRDKITKEVWLICLYNPWNVNDNSLTWLIDLDTCANIAFKYIENSDENIQKIRKETEKKIILQYFQNTGIKLNESDSLVQIFLAHIMLANRKLNIEHWWKYLEIKDYYTEEIAKHENAKLISLDWWQSIFLLHNDITNPKVIHFRWNKWQKRKFGWEWQIILHNDKISYNITNRDELYKWMIWKDWILRIKTDFIDEI